MYPGLYFLCFTFIHYISLPFPRNVSEKTEPQPAQIVSLSQLSIWPEEVMTVAILHIRTNVGRKKSERGEIRQWCWAFPLRFSSLSFYWNLILDGDTARCSTELSREHNQAIRQHHLE